MTGCMDPDAVNYNIDATETDHSCVYIIKHNGICHVFTEVQPAVIEDRSFTLSYSVEGQCWTFYHDYIPDFYLATRDKLFNFENNESYVHHEGPVGTYHSGTKPFFIDIIFNGKADMLLESVQWVTEFMQNNTDQTQNTLTHITIWNSSQHTSRIPLDALNIRRTKGEWSFDDFRDILKENAEVFLKDIFGDYMLDETKKEEYLVWYNQKTIQDSWFCVRFEFDNTTDAQVIVHDTTVQALKTDR